MKPLCLFLMFAFSAAAFGQQKTPTQRANELLKLMTLDEKVGQLNQLSSDFATGPITPDGEKQDRIRRGEIGSLLNVYGAQRTRQLQQMAMQTRLKIPLLFAQDIIHGMRTMLPIPLAEAASWDLQAIEQSARIAAIEASATGLHWTFAPMVDIARDPRWGRVMEGAGEDPYLASKISAARVKGFQGKGLGHTDAMMACAKHFAAYGAAIGGRDYNSVDMSNNQLFNVYLPPFKAANEAGVATFMNAFNDLNGIPANGSAFLQRDILKKRWNFKGFVVSDWGSIGDMVWHGYANDLKDAAQKAITTGSDMDMESRAYVNHLKQLVQAGKVTIKFVDDAVRRILVKKFEMGLFDDPFKFSNDAREKAQWNNPEHLAFAQSIAQKSIVLLKNDGVLPLPKNQKIAFVGPLVKEQKAHLGYWSFDWDDDSARIVSLWMGVQEKTANTNLLYAKGCNINDSSTTQMEEAVAVTQQADIVVMYLGEARDMAGEAKSRSNIELPGVQMELFKKLKATGKKIVVVVGAGRPLVLGEINEKADAVVYSWWLGIQGGAAIADVLFGDYNPSGRLPMSFPRSVGQIPIYYNYLSTGKPFSKDDEFFYVTGYTDQVHSPQYVFGYGLSYSTFEYGKIQVSDTALKGNKVLKVTVAVGNNSKVDGEETVQLYIRDLVAAPVRPVKELKAFKKLLIKAGETKLVEFAITPDDLKYYNGQLKYDWDAGDFEIMVGSNSADVQKATIRWEK